MAAAGWSAKGLCANLAAIAERADDLTPDMRQIWMDGLRQVWRRHHWAMAAAHRYRLMELAAAWSDWPLVAWVAQTLGDARQGSMDVHGALLLFEARFRQGELARAGDVLLHWQLAHPRDGRLAAARARLEAQQAFCRRWPAFAGADYGDAELRLEPLSHHHATDFAWQYADPSIAELCRLPVFEDSAQWHGWLDGLYGEGDELPLSIWHRELGFLGCCHLVLTQGVGYLYYWLGAAYRGQGLAQRAAGVLLAAARDEFGMHTCYAKAYLHNESSRRLLARLGFQEAGIEALADPDVESFHRLGEPLQRQRIVDELYGLLGRMGSQTRIAALLQVSPCAQ
ncbi:MAG: GNAT family N-acetyltransferase [Rhodocyclaceae bacterium]|nr:GNAT family N-acetyltransferase [Rhodocyclaceae bacterium]